VALSRRTSKRTGFITGGIAWIVVMFVSFLITPGSPWLAVYIFAALVGFGTGGIVVMIYAIFPDIPDVDELQSGQRREGIYGALISLARKLSSAFAIFAVANVLGLAGYVRPVEQVVNGVSTLVDQPQSAQFILVLRLIFALLPVILVSCAVFFASRYPLNGPVHSRLNTLLAQRRGGAVESAETAAEAEALKGLLIA
jgi:GPH family glycoside/pentoside/hexuronide:cation symporter